LNLVREVGATLGGARLFVVRTQDVAARRTDYRCGERRTVRLIVDSREPLSSPPRSGAPIGPDLSSWFLYERSFRAIFKMGKQGRRQREKRNDRWDEGKGLMRKEGEAISLWEFNFSICDLTFAFIRG
jgi:hypothetical protein